LEENKAPWGYHLLLDCKNGTEAIKSKEAVKDFLKDLVVTIDMVAYGEPIVEHFATHCPEKAGLSGVQLIETSNITLHFVDKNNNGYIDIFSCKPFREDDAVDCVQKHFDFETVNARFVNRDAERKF
jgi:S-adenosylmethionine/arginine decarboxylase-like enzyme